MTNEEITLVYNWFINSSFLIKFFLLFFAFLIVVLFILFIKYLLNHKYVTANTQYHLEGKAKGIKYLSGLWAWFYLKEYRDSVKRKKPNISKDELWNLSVKKIVEIKFINPLKLWLIIMPGIIILSTLVLVFVIILYKII